MTSINYYRLGTDFQPFVLNNSPGQADFSQNFNSFYNGPRGNFAKGPISITTLQKQINAGGFVDQMGRSSTEFNKPHHLSEKKRKLLRTYRLDALPMRIVAAHVDDPIEIFGGGGGSGGKSGGAGGFYNTLNNEMPPSLPGNTPSVSIPPSIPKLTTLGVPKLPPQSHHLIKHKSQFTIHQDVKDNLELINHLIEHLMNSVKYKNPDEKKASNLRTHARFEINSMAPGAQPITELDVNEFRKNPIDYAGSHSVIKPDKNNLKYVDTSVQVNLPTSPRNGIQSEIQNDKLQPQPKPLTNSESQTDEKLIHAQETQTNLPATMSNVEVQTEQRILHEAAVQANEPNLIINTKLRTGRYAAPTEFDYLSTSSSSTSSNEFRNNRLYPRIPESVNIATQILSGFGIDTLQFVNDRTGSLIRNSANAISNTNIHRNAYNSLVSSLATLIERLPGIERVFDNASNFTLPNINTFISIVDSWTPEETDYARSILNIILPQRSLNEQNIIPPNAQNIQTYSEIFERFIAAGVGADFLNTTLFNLITRFANFFDSAGLLINVNRFLGRLRRHSEIAYSLHRETENPVPPTNTPNNELENDALDPRDDLVNSLMNSIKKVKKRRNSMDLTLEKAEEFLPESSRMGMGRNEPRASKKPLEEWKGTNASSKKWKGKQKKKE